MTRKGKICLIVVSAFLSLAVIAVIDNSVNNWWLKHKIRAAFKLTSESIDTNTLQTAAQTLFPIGTSEQNVRTYLARYFGTNSIVRWEMAEGPHVFCSFDSENGWSYRDSFVVEFFLDGNYRVSRIESHQYGTSIYGNSH
jgi:hypothetical protein